MAVNLITSASFSAASTVDITTGIDSTYMVYELFIFGLTVSVDDANLSLRVSTDGGSTFKASSGDYRIGFGGTPGEQNQALGFSYWLTPITGSLASIGNATGEQFAGVVTIYDPSNTTEYKTMNSIGTYTATDGNPEAFYGGCLMPSTDDIDALRIFPNTGTITGQYALYGLDQS